MGFQIDINRKTLLNFGSEDTSKVSPKIEKR